MFSSLLRRSSRLLRAFSDLPEHTVLGMPLLSPTMKTGTIVRWLKKEGEQVRSGETMLELETDKSTMGFEVQEDIVIAKIIEPDGSADIPVGQPIAVLVEEEDQVSAFASYKVQDSAPPPSPSSASTAEKETSSADTKNVRMSPTAHAMVDHFHIDPSNIKPTGPKNILTKTDVLNFMENTPQEKLTQGTQDSAPKKQPQAPMSQSQSQSQSTVTVPRFSVTIECLLDKMIGMFPGELHNAFILKCAARACMDHPETNGRFFADFSRMYNFVDMKVTNEEAGTLNTYYVTDAHSKTLGEISKESSEESPYTFSVHFGAVLAETPHTACSLSVGPTFDKTVIQEKQLVSKQAVDFTLNCDHRIVDGAKGAQWMNSFKKYLENPLSLI